MAWWFLLAAGGFEILMALSLKNSQGWTRFWPSVSGIGAAACSMTLLTLAVKSIPVSTGYAIWTGIGALGVTIVGIFYLEESSAPLRLLCLALIFVGMIGLRLIEG